MKYFNYKIARDFGFAPNPFGGICSLATCKPRIRNAARIDDWVIGTGSKSLNRNHELIYAMKVTKKISFNAYWNMSEYQFKKPVLNGSLVKMYGDNIYHQDNSGNWCQANSHHSLEDGRLNELNLYRDTHSENVLLSNQFYFFGSKSIKFNRQYTFIERQGFKYLKKNEGEMIINFLSSNYKFGIHGDPVQFKSKFLRYNGK